MNTLYAFLLTVVFYPILGTLLFVLVEKFNASTKIKVLIMTFGHPLLTGIVVWLLGSTINRQIGEAGVYCVIGTLLRIPFSDRRYFSTVIKESGAVSVEYFSELLKRKTIRFTDCDITDFTQSTSQHIFDKPSELTVNWSNQVFKFIVLNKRSVVTF